MLEKELAQAAKMAEQANKTGCGAEEKTSGRYQKKRMPKPSVN